MVRTLIRIAALCLPFVAIWWFFSKESPFATLGLEENHHSGGEELKTVHALAKDKFSWETVRPISRSWSIICIYVV
jgi:hypothetical protein